MNDEQLNNMTTDKLKSLSREELVEKGVWKCGKKKKYKIIPVEQINNRHLVGIINHCLDMGDTFCAQKLIGEGDRRVKLLEELKIKNKNMNTQETSKQTEFTSLFEDEAKTTEIAKDPITFRRLVNPFKKKYKVGEKVGHFEILEVTPGEWNYGYSYKVKCDCGKIKKMLQSFLDSKPKSCGPTCKFRHQVASKVNTNTANVASNQCEQKYKVGQKVANWLIIGVRSAANRKGFAYYTQHSKGALKWISQYRLERETKIRNLTRIAEKSFPVEPAIQVDPVPAKVKRERILAAIDPIAASQPKLSVFQTIKGWFA